MFRLALQLGRTVSELEDSLSSSELVEWMALYEMEPWGVWRDNYHHAMQCALLANVHRGKNQSAVSAADFMLKDEQERREKETAHFLKSLDVLSRKH